MSGSPRVGGRGRVVGPRLGLAGERAVLVEAKGAEITGRGRGVGTRSRDRYEIEADEIEADLGGVR